MSMQREPAVDDVTGGKVPETHPDPAAFQQGTGDAPSPADGGTTEPPPAGGATQPAQPPQTFTAEDIERARREEKDKLYGEIGTLKESMTALQAAEAERQEAARKEQERVAQEAEQARLAEMSALERVEEIQRQTDARFAEIEKERAAERALYEREQEFLRLQQYITETKAANTENIMPQLLDLIGGGTKEEVDASVVTLIDRTASILADITEAMPPAGGQGPTAPRGTSVTAPPVGPSDNQQDQRTFSAEEIAAMPMSEYAKHRSGLLDGAGRRVREHGLYN